MSLKLFDLDGTLLDCDTSSLFCRYLVDKQLTSDEDF
jgi:FMN phosphatase YigB (HAD superfamily)